MEKQLCSPTTTPSSLTMQKKNSQTISKVKPKIRIIHIFSPKIIKTDAANFRELVQRLTGKPTGDDEIMQKKKISRKKLEPTIFSSSRKKMEMGLSLRAGFDSAAKIREKIKGEEEIWDSANSGGGFLGGFTEFDVFVQELNQFPFLEGTTQMDGCGMESKLAV